MYQSVLASLIVIGSACAFLPSYAHAILLLIQSRCVSATGKSILMKRDWDETMDLESGNIKGENSMVADFEDWYYKTYGKK